MGRWEDMSRLVAFALLLLSVACLLLTEALAQGETTSAILGQVRDTSNAVVPGATVTIANPETGLRRTANTDEGGRFNFPQLKPGTYSVKVEAQGFEPKQNDNVVSGLGQKQTVDFTLRVARLNETVEVSSETPLLNPADANTSTTLDAPALEDLPNPGGDLTYPLQFTPGALINTAGSGNDFVGGTNGYGNVEFNGLPALSNGYIVDGLETNDPLTNLNSGLSTNLVLGLNSISEVTVNTSPIPWIRGGMEHPRSTTSPSLARINFTGISMNCGMVRYSMRRTTLPMRRRETTSPDRP